MRDPDGNELPKAFQEEDEESAREEPRQPEAGQFGAGRFVTSAVDDSVRNRRRHANEHGDSQEVEEADEESFPASDAPAFTGNITDPER